MLDNLKSLFSCCKLKPGNGNEIQVDPINSDSKLRHPDDYTELKRDSNFRNLTTETSEFRNVITCKSQVSNNSKYLETESPTSYTNLFENKLIDLNSQNFTENFDEMVKFI